jgi:hypothetical protein
MYKFRRTRFCLPDDIVSLLCTFLWRNAKLRADELSADVDFYCLWRKTVPPIFLKCAVLDIHQWFHVANPMREGHPYWPRKLLNLEPKNVWGDTLFAFGSMICRERIRDVRTYKRCALRWIRACTDNIDIWYWWDLKQKLLCKIKPEHFHPRAHQAFLQEALSQLSFYKVSFAS